MKEPGNKLISIGWILLVVSLIAVIGMILEPSSRDPSIEAFLKHPDSLSLAGTIGVIIGSNTLSLFAISFGIYAAVKKNQKGKPLLTQLSQLGTEIGTFDSGRAVSFHHKADCSVDGYTPLAVVVSATSH